MARGVFSGLIWGTVVAGLGAGGLSLAYPEFAPGAPQMPKQMADAVQSEGEGAMAADAAKPDEASAAEMTPQQPAPEAETQSAEISPDQPKEDQADTDQADADQPEAEDSRALDDDAPVLPSETDMVADATDTEVAAEMSEGTRAAQDPTDVIQLEADPAAASTDTAPAANDQPTAPTPSEPMQSEPMQSEIGQTEPLQQELEQPAPEPSVERVQTADEARPQDVAEEAAVAPQTEPAQPATPDTVPAEDPAVSITEEIIASLPNTTSGTGTIGNLAPNVTTGRLPSIGTSDPLQGDTTAGDTTLGDTTLGDASQTSQADAAPDAVPPLVAFAESFDPPGDRPLMSIVLIDDGQTRLGPEALETFPYPLTFAVDAAAENAAERMALYRGKGFEVMALAGLPQGATPSDVEVAMTAYLAAVPEAVAVLEAPDVSLQTNRAVSDQVTQIIQASGHGLVLQANGLNTAQKLAAREGVSSAAVFRDFDGKGQGATVIRRFLDQAAFRARQEGGVVMLGRLQPETISALLIWGLADRASRVALVPVSGVLTALNAQAPQ